MSAYHPQTASRERIHTFISAETDRLLRACRVYVIRLGIATSETAQTAAAELLNEVVVEALEHADRFDPSRDPMVWLLGIAINLIRRKRADLGKRNWREPLVRDLYGAPENTLSEAELFDQLATLATPPADPALVVERDSEIATLLAGLSPEDQHLLKLAIWHELDGQSLASALGISPGAARVRVYRALRRLREIHQALEDESDEHR
jgi:RNA polymerase sigma-70 factor (ECF subfamily)